MVSSMLKGKTILVTGGSGLIGSSVCDSIKENGGRAISLDLEQSVSISCESLIVDCTDSSSLDYALFEAVKRYGVIHGAVHSAYPKTKHWGEKFGSIDYTRLSRDISMQLGSAILFSQVMHKYFLSKGDGSFVHLGSIQGINAPKFEHYECTSMTSPIEYSAVKAGVIAMTKWLAKYSFNSGIRFNCVSPGGVLDGQDKGFVERYRRACSSVGMLKSSDVSDTICFLLSDLSSRITGQNIVVDDGWTL